MADVYNFITETGTITTDAGVILEEVANEYKNVFGQDLVVPDSLNIEGASTPQGMLIVTEALARIAVADNNAAVANQINPNLAGGIFLDAILALTGLQRTPATYSTTVAVFTGVEGTSIPEGSQAQTADGNLFATVNTEVIPLGGVLTNVAMRAVNPGVIACDTDALTLAEGGSIVSDVLGWETIQSNTDAILGTATQSDVAARAMRLATLAVQGSSVAQAIMSRIQIVEGVKSLTFLENPAPSTQTISDVEMPAHSIYACVDGGSNLAVAEALVSRKSAGAAYCNTSGESPAKGIPISQNVTVPFSGQVQTVLFDRPTPIEILVDITVKIITPLQSPVDAIKEAILQYVNGDIDGMKGLVVGQSVSSFEIAGAVTSIYPGVYVQSVLISIDPTPPASSAEIPMEIYQIADIDENNIAVHLL